MILARFGDGDNWGSPPLGWKAPRYPYTIKDILQDHKCLFREVLQEDIVDAIRSRGSWLGLQDCSSKISKSEAFVVYLCVLGFKIEVFLLGLLFDLKEFLWIVCWGRIACKSRSMLISNISGSGYSLTVFPSEILLGRANILSWDFPNPVPYMFDRGVCGQLWYIIPPGVSLLLVEESPGSGLRSLEWDECFLVGTTTTFHLVVQSTSGFKGISALLVKPGVRLSGDCWGFRDEIISNFDNKIHKGLKRVWAL